MNWIQKYSLPLFLVIAAAQWYVPISMIAGFEDVMEVGTAFKFKAQPVDPFNPFYGRYMSINYEIRSIVIPRNVELNESEIAFISVAEDENGFAIIEEITHERPLTDNYFTARIDYIDFYYRTESQQFEQVEEEEFAEPDSMGTDSDPYFGHEVEPVPDYVEPDSMRIEFDIPFTEFYLNQEIAPVAEDIFGEGIRDSARVYGLVKIHKGQAILEMLFIDDSPITELARRRIEEVNRQNSIENAREEESPAVEETETN